MRRISVMTIRVMASDEEPDDRNQEVVQSLDWSKVEDFINDMVPEGYYAKVDDH